MRKWASETKKGGWTWTFGFSVDCGRIYTCDSDFWNVVLFLCVMIILAEVTGSNLLFWSSCMFYQIGDTGRCWRGTYKDRSTSRSDNQSLWTLDSSSLLVTSCLIHPSSFINSFHYFSFFFFCLFFSLFSSYCIPGQVCLAVT